VDLAGSGGIHSIEARIRLFQYVGDTVDSKCEPIVRNRLFTFHHWLAPEYAAAGGWPGSRLTCRQSLESPDAVERLRETDPIAAQAYVSAIYRLQCKMKRASR
jgi:hypothetical protein